jgi:hypothetical protein
MAYVSVTGPLTTTLTGKIIDDKGEYVKFLSKKPRSSKFLEQLIAKKDIISVYGKPGEDGAQITYATVGEITGAEGTVSINKDGNLVVTDAAGDPTTFIPTAGYSIASVEQVDGPEAE